MSTSDLDKLRNLDQAPDQNPTKYVFLSGADMDPGSVNTNYPGAVFVARAEVQARQGEVNPHFAHDLIPSGRGVVWGIVIETPQAHASDRQRTVTTDHGRDLTANLAGDRFAMGDPAAVLRAAHYWELFPGYVALLDARVHHLGIDKTNRPSS